MPAKATCPKPRKLRAVLAGVAPPQVKREVEEHLQGCKACRAFFLALPSANPTQDLNGQPEPAAESRTQISMHGLKLEGRVGKKDERFPFLQPALEPGEIGRLGNYRVLRLLGQGGMGMVFLGEDVALKRPVALKVMKPTVDDPDNVQRFLREARTMAALKHDHLVTIFQTGQEAEVAWFAMELLQGESLHDRLGRGPITEAAEILRIGKELAEGLACLHAKGLMHRDIKPPNIWLEEPGAKVKILDLGLTRPVEEAAPLTQVGAVVGTPGFMSPEQARGETLDARSDLFSLGCVLYCLCAAREPFRGKSILAILMALASETPTPPHEVNPQIPKALSDLVLSLLAKKPEGRPKSAAEVRDRLESIAAGKEVQPTRVIDAPGPGPVPPPVRKKNDQVMGQTMARKVQAPRTQMAAWPEEPVYENIRKKGKSRNIKRKRGKGMPLLIIGAAMILILGIGTLLISKLTRTGAPAAAGEKARAAVPIFLSSLEPRAQENWPFFPPPNPMGEVPGKVIRVQGRERSNSIFMHAPKKPGTPASLTYDLGGKYDTFQAEVTLNDGPPQCPPMTFAVFGDGKLLWSSRPVTSQADAQTCRVSVKGVGTLRIQATCAGAPFGAHGVWVEPRVE